MTERRTDRQTQKEEEEEEIEKQTTVFTKSDSCDMFPKKEYHLFVFFQCDGQTEDEGQLQTIRRRPNNITVREHPSLYHYSV